MSKRSINKISCPTCGRSMNEREITLYSGMVTTLWRVYQWCEEKGRHEFVKKEVKHLMVSDVVSSTFAYWRWFGGLAYNPDGIQGHYGLNMERCEQFFSGKLEIPMTLWKHPITKVIRKENYATIENVPWLREFLDENDNYIARYRTEPGQQSLI